MATRLGEPVRISKCGRCSVRFSTPGAGSPPWNCPHCDKRIARDALRVRAERRLRCPVCLASIAHRGPCAVTCGRSCAMRLHRARRRIRVASSAPLLCPVCGPPPAAWVGAGAALRDRGCRRAGVCLRAVLDVDRGEDDGAGRGVTVALMATRYPRRALRIGRFFQSGRDATRGKLDIFATRRFLRRSNVTEDRVNVIVEPGCVLVPYGSDFSNDRVSLRRSHDLAP